MLPHRFPLAVLILALGSCAAPLPPAAAVPTPIGVTPAPPVAQGTFVPPVGDWRDWPMTAADWRYAANAGGSAASFGMQNQPPLLILACDRAARRIVVSRNSAPTAAITIRTSSLSRTLPVEPAVEGRATARVSASDPLLDAMAFSRGRFVVQQVAVPPLVVPPWSEVARVVEDCRG